MRFIVMMAFVLFALGTGCTRGCRTAKEAPKPFATPFTENTPPFKNGAMLFGFDYQKVTELLLVKADPSTGDHWGAHLSRPNTQRPDEWEIRTAGGAVAPLDHRADSFFIFHLLDTLRTLHVENTEAPGPHASLGLAPPRFALQWRAEGKEFEVRIGLPVDGGKNAYAWVPGHPAFIVGGATLQMLDYLNGFAALRLKTWTGVTADEVDEIEIPIEGKAVFYAQREGDEWTGRDHKKLRSEKVFADWLEKLVHQRVNTFIDDAKQVEALRAQIQKAPLRQVTLKDRHGQSIVLQLSLIDKKWMATSSARPDGVFAVFPESSQALEAPVQGVRK